MRYLTAPFRYFAFFLIGVAYMICLIAKELSIPVRKWWRRTWP
ncbi:hypothetical protein CHELA1G11_10879 [Hyphomicrobiales bacterium]|nr:hypothetical protein CHELA1G11_10879 [Hyphomicrobiales bacterium]